MIPSALARQNSFSLLSLASCGNEALQTSSVQTSSELSLQCLPKQTNLLDMVHLQEDGCVCDAISNAIELQNSTNPAQHV